MLQPLPVAAQAVSFIGAGLTMVAYGASASVGLTDRGENLEPSPARTSQTAEESDHGIAESLGCRLEVYACKGY